MPTFHALLSPSSSKRWMTCTPSARLEAQEPDKETAYAEEGTIAHAVAECQLDYYLARNAELVYEDAWAECSKFHTFDSQLDGLAARCLEKGFDYRDIFETVHNRYVAIVWATYIAARNADPDAELLVEATLKLDDFIPEGFGSSDAVIIAGHSLQVFDLKYGQGVKVDANHNTQMMCYALGAIHGPGETYPVEDVTMTIIQPRLSHVSSFTMKADLLESWGHTELAPRASKAFWGNGSRVPGDHCKFCRVAARCRALATYASVLEAQGADPALLSMDELSDMLHRLGALRTLISSLEEYAMSKALAGTPVPGWKLVEGRGSRVITDPEGAAAALAQAGYTEADIYKPAELRTISELEKLTGRKAFASLLGSYVTKKAGKPALAPEDDPRPAFSPADSAARDFEDLA